MKRIPSDQITIELSQDDNSVIASLFEYPEGYRYYNKYPISELPNNLISLDDLKRFGINLVDSESIRSSPAF